MIHRFSGHAGWVTGLAFSPDGRRALSSGEDRVIRLWDLGSRATIREFRGHTDWAISVAFSPDGRLAYSTGGARSVWRDGTDFAVRIWDVEAGRQVGKMEGHRGLVFGLAVSADGRRVLTGGDTIILWNAETRAEIRRFNRHTDKVSRVAFLPIGQPPFRQVGTGRSDSGISKPAKSFIASTLLRAPISLSPRRPHVDLLALQHTGAAALGCRVPQAA